MSLYAKVKTGGRSVANAICPRCQMRVAYDDLKKDPNTESWYCPDCVDLYDPWRLPARIPEDISLAHPRPDTDISINGGVVFPLPADGSED